MKVLILTHRIPFPQNGGYPIVVCNTIKGLLDLGHEVSLFALNAKQHAHYHEEGTESHALISRIKYKSYPINIQISMYEGLLNLFDSRAQYISRFYNQGFDKMLIEELQANQYDIVQFEGLFVSPYLATVAKYSKARLVYRSHNIEHQVWQQLAAQKGDPIKRWYLNLMASRIKKYELQQLQRFDAIIVFTVQDKEAMLQYDVKPGTINVLPVGLEVNQYQPDYSQTEFPSLFFLGSLDWMPNREGIQWFLNSFYHDLSTGELNVRFYVAGNDIPESFDEYEVMGKIYIQGEVDNGLEFVNSKAIMIVPLLSSGGMRVKIIEGMAMQKCIISTSLGAEGINYTHGKNILIANTREEFFSCISKCIKDEDYCLQIGRNARELVAAAHDINVVTNKLVAFYQQVLNG